MAVGITRQNVCIALTRLHAVQQQEEARVVEEQEEEARVVVEVSSWLLSLFLHQ